jgi:hypothetical protein
MLYPPDYFSQKKVIKIYVMRFLLLGKNNLLDRNNKFIILK